MTSPVAWNWRSLLGPAGGFVAAASFFLPWGKFSFLLLHKSASGHTIGGWAWVIFAMAALAVAAGVILPLLRRPALARAVVFGAALLGLLFFAIKAGQLARGLWTPFGRLQPQDVGVKPGIGAQGILVGFLLAVVGAFTMPVPESPLRAFGRLRQGWRAARTAPVTGAAKAGAAVTGDRGKA